jgi:acetolactate synthase-1/2/3 large subunit
MQEMLDSDQPYVLDVICPYTEHVMPFIPAGGRWRTCGRWRI